MRHRRLLLVVLLAACGDAAPHDDRIPDALAELVLVEDHPQISPALFPHRLHADAARMEGAVACVDCHHELADESAAPATDVPRRCTECHVYAYLAPPVDEDQPHDHDQPPDL